MTVLRFPSAVRPSLFFTWLIRQRDLQSDLGWLARSAEFSAFGNDECEPDDPAVMELASKGDWLAYMIRLDREYVHVALTLSNIGIGIPAILDIAFSEFELFRRGARSVSRRKRALVMERDGFKCRRCGFGPPERRIVIDHVVPVARGGDASESNLQTLCEWCNIGKADRPPHPHDLGAR